MENKRFYSRKNYENDDEYFRKLNNIDKSKNWLFQNYIGGYYTSKNNRNNLFLSTPNNYDNPTNNEYNRRGSGLFFELNRKEKEIQKRKEKEQYRKDLLKQIEENEKRKQKLKIELYEENKVNDFKNNEYLLYKKEQEEEYEKLKKLNKNRKLKNEFIITNQKELTLNYNKNEDENKGKEEKINNNAHQEEIKNEKIKERIKEEMFNNYNSIISSNYPNIFGEKEELINYIDKEFQDFENIFDNNNDIENNKYENLFYNEDLGIINNNEFKNENKRYYINNNNLQNNIDKSYNSIFEKIEYVNDLTKSFKMKMKPSKYFNHKRDILLDSFSNMILQADNKSDKKDNYIKNKIKSLTNGIKEEEKISNNIEKKDAEKDLNEKSSNKNSTENIEIKKEEKEKDS